VRNGFAPARILVVDDDADARDLATALLEQAGHVCSGATDASHAMRLLGSGEGYALALCDIRMPGISGMDLARHVVAEYPDTAALMVTGVDDPVVAETAVAFGVFGYVLKPYRPLELTSAVSAALRRRELCMESRRSQDALERRVEEQTAELRDALRQLQEAAGAMSLSQEEALRRLARAIEFRSLETSEHVRRVADTSAVVGRRLQLESWRCERLRMASSMHDVGKVAVPDRILLKPGPLDEQERGEMQHHTRIGHEVLTGSGSEVLELAATIALTHHERFNGSGYPRGLRGEEIPLEGRIVAVADVFDALTHERVYRPAMAEETALEVLHDGRASHFDPDVLDCFVASIEDVRAIAEARVLPVG
jgi:putative two-component system response regulator